VDSPTLYGRFAVKAASLAGLARSLVRLRLPVLHT
jgi:hypothetical protein